jgi:hypothetical protein
MNTASRVATGVAGIAAVVLLFAGQFVGAIGSRTEPAFGSSTREIVAFLGSLRSGPQTAGSVIVLVGLVAFLTFAAGLRDVLAPAGQGLPALAVRERPIAAHLHAVGAPYLERPVDLGMFDRPAGPPARRPTATDASTLSTARRPRRRKPSNSKS